MKQKIIQTFAIGITLGISLVIGVSIAVYAGSLNPTASNSLSNGSPIASMLSLLDMAQTTSGTFDRATDSLEAISNKIDGIGSITSTPLFVADLTTGNITLPGNTVTGTFENLIFTETIDNTNNYNPANGQFTVPSTDLYEFTANISFLAVAGVKNRSVRIIKNGTTVIGGSWSTGTSTWAYDSVNVSRVVNVTQGDIITFDFYGVGTDQILNSDTSGSWAYKTFIQGKKL